jgi:dienelactone hydrolase
VHEVSARAGQDELEEGPYEVERAVYDLGDEAFVPSRLGRGVELVGDVHYPAGLPDGPYPLVLFLHGNHSSCYRGRRTRFQWPCPNGWAPLPNYEGYDYVARRLASFGFVVASAGANGVNVHGSRLRSTGMRQRGELLERHLDLWRDWSTAGGDPFGTDFVGNVDLERIGTMGHSRGGEGAIWQVILDRRRPDPYEIDAVLPLAPVDFTRRTVNNVPLSVMLPYCDGDVSDLQGIHFFDDARYRREGDPTPKHTVTVFGANHNFFNTVWTPGEYPGSFDDGNRPCGRRLDPEGQRRVGSLFIADFFRRYLADAVELDPLWIGAEPPSELAPDQALVSYHAPDLPDRRRDLDRFTGPSDISVNALGGRVAPRRMERYEWCAETWRDACVPGPLKYSDVHLTGLSQGVLGWTSRDASVRFRIPSGRSDVAGFDALQLRVAPNPGYAQALGVPRQNFVVELTDRAGVSASVPASRIARQALTFPPGLQRFAGHVILNQLRFPLELFEGVDLGDIRDVEVEFSRHRRGAINVADLAFTAGAG